MQAGRRDDSLTGTAGRRGQAAPRPSSTLPAIEMPPSIPAVARARPSATFALGINTVAVRCWARAALQATSLTAHVPPFGVDLDPQPFPSENGGHRRGGPSAAEPPIGNLGSSKEEKKIYHRASCAKGSLASVAGAPSDEFTVSKQRAREREQTVQRGQIKAPLQCALSAANHLMHSLLAWGGEPLTQKAPRRPP